MHTALRTVSRIDHKSPLSRSLQLSLRVDFSCGAVTSNSNRTMSQQRKVRALDVAHLKTF